MQSFKGRKEVNRERGNQTDLENILFNKSGDRLGLSKKRVFKNSYQHKLINEGKDNGEREREKDLREKTSK